MKLTRAEYAALLRGNLSAFIERAFAELNPQTAFMPARHIEVIAATLQKVSRGEITRLIINLPPRHLKSLCTSVAFPAWYLGHHPAAHVICASYGQELADKLARDCRTVMTSPWYRGLFATQLAGRTAVHDFATTDHGGRMATSVGGILTGRGADLIVIDDPLKPDEALSLSRRTAVNEWYDNSLLSRLDDKARGAIVVVMQRLHQDDLVGHVLEQGRWEVLSFAAIAEEDEAPHRHLLWPTLVSPPHRRGTAAGAGVAGDACRHSPDHRRLQLRGSVPAEPGSPGRSTGQDRLAALL